MLYADAVAVGSVPTAEVWETGVYPESDVAKTGKGFPFLPVTVIGRYHWSVSCPLQSPPRKHQALSMSCPVLRALERVLIGLSGCHVAVSHVFGSVKMVSDGSGECVSMLVSHGSWTLVCVWVCLWVVWRQGVMGVVSVRSPVSCMETVSDGVCLWVVWRWRVMGMVSVSSFVSCVDGEWLEWWVCAFVCDAWRWHWVCWWPSMWWKGVKHWSSGTCSWMYRFWWKLFSGSGCKIT